MKQKCIIFENAVVRSNADHSASIGNYCLIGPNAHVVGGTVEDEVFIATGAAIFHNARLGKDSQPKRKMDSLSSRGFEQAREPKRGMGGYLRY